MTRPAGVLSEADAARDVHVACDVVVVGSGAGGATVAAELADAGMDVVIVEEGGYHGTEEFSADTGWALRTLYRDGGAQFALGKPPVLMSEGRCVGGSTVINGGMSWRTPPRVLDRWAREEHVAGIDGEAMEPWFERVERRVSVALQDPETVGRDSELIRAGAAAKGWKVLPNLRNQLHCAGSNNCAFGCPSGAKRSMLVTNIPRALGRGARLFADCRVERVTRAGKRATGIRGRFMRPGGRAGPALTVDAGVVVVACGALQTPALLARSGVRSPSRQLGRNLTLHPNAKVVAVFDEDVSGWKGVHQAFQVREFQDDGIIFAAVNLPPSLLSMGLPHHGAALGEVMQDYNRIVVAGCLVEDSTSGRVRTVPGIGPVASYQVTPLDVQRVIRGVAVTAEALFAAGANRVMLPFAGRQDLLSADDVRTLFDEPIPPDTIELLTVHVMGTARMSDDRNRGVVSSYGEVHDADRLFVADASLFPGPIGVNPMETVLALAARNAAWMVEHRDRFGI